VLLLAGLAITQAWAEDLYNYRTPREAQDWCTISLRTKPANGPALPLVLLIGDSITVRCAAEVGTALKDKAYVSLLGTSKAVGDPALLDEIKLVLRQNVYAVTHFNYGLHGGLEQELGGDCMAMFLQGASGDLAPYDLHNLRGENRFNIVKQAGIALGKAALQLAASLKARPASVQPVLQVKESLLTIPHRSGAQSTEVGLLTVVIQRDLALVAIPGEPFVQHQLDLTAKSPVPNAFILGLAYSGRGTPFTVYLPTVQAVKEGGYGAAECSFLAADAGERLVNEAVARIHALVSEFKAAK
jgi:hypothetical protein